MISAIEIVNWKTTSACLNLALTAPCFTLPFNATIGLNEERKKAGYAPAKIVVVKTNSVMNIQKYKLAIGKIICFPESSLNTSNEVATIKMETTSEANEYKNDSAKNC